MNIATSAHELPVFIDVGPHLVFGIVTEPTVASNGWGVVLAPGADNTATPGRNRLSVRMARRYAALGFHVLRIDFRGVGESTGEAFYDLADPMPEDMTAGIQWLRRAYPVERVLVVGTCFGGCSGLAAAAGIGAVAGVALLASPVRWERTTQEMLGTMTRGVARRVFRREVWRGLRDPERSRLYAQMIQTRVRRMARQLRSQPGRRGSPEVANPRFVRDLERVVARRARVLMIFGAEDREYEMLKRARSGALGDVLRQSGELVTVEVTPGEVHGNASLAGQDLVVERTEAWLTEMTGIGGAAVDRSAWTAI